MRNPLMRPPLGRRPNASSGVTARARAKHAQTVSAPPSRARTIRVSALAHATRLARARASRDRPASSPAIARAESPAPMATVVTELVAEPVKHATSPTPSAAARRWLQLIRLTRVTRLAWPRILPVTAAATDRAPSVHTQPPHAAQLPVPAPATKRPGRAATGLATHLPRRHARMPAWRPWVVQTVRLTRFDAARVGFLSGVVRVALGRTRPRARTEIPARLVAAAAPTRPAAAPASF